MLYADSKAVKAITHVVAAEDEQALVARDNCLPHLATYFDCLWGIDPADWFKGAATDIDNNHAAWLVRKPPTPTGRTPKHPYEVWFNAQDYGQANWSSGTIWYRTDGTVDRVRLIYWRSRTMYDVCFEASETKLLLTSVSRTKDETKTVLWDIKRIQQLARSTSTPPPTGS